MEIRIEIEDGTQTEKFKLPFDEFKKETGEDITKQFIKGTLIKMIDESEVLKSLK